MHQHKRIHFRRVQLLERGPGLQEAILLLSDHHLRAWLHARHRLVGLLLARPPRRPCSRGSGRHHPAHHVHPDGIHQLCPTSRGLHESHRCLAGTPRFHKTTYAKQRGYLSLSSSPTKSESSCSKLQKQRLLEFFPHPLPLLSKVHQTETPHRLFSSMSLIPRLVCQPQRRLATSRNETHSSKATSAIDIPLTAAPQ